MYPSHFVFTLFDILENQQKKQICNSTSFLQRADLKPMDPVDALVDALADALVVALVVAPMTDAQMAAQPDPLLCAPSALLLKP